MSYLKVDYEWKRLPTRLVTSGLLRELRWQGDGIGASNTAGLMLYMAIGFYAVQRVDVATGLHPGEASATYEQLQEFTGLSRELVSRGLRKLEEWGLIRTRQRGRRSIYVIQDFDDRIWMKIPCRYFYGRRQVKSPLADLSVRNQHTFYAMKLYFVIMERRNTKTNHTALSYPRLEHYSGVPRMRIKKAISTLVTHNLIFCDMAKHYLSDYRHNIYRVRGIGDYVHRGTLPDERLDELMHPDD